MNLYAFCGNSPIKRIDFQGLAPCSTNSKKRKCNNSTCEERTRKQNSKPISTNGCGPRILIFDFDLGQYLVPDSAIGDWDLFNSACNEHDRCYGTCGSDKESCDTKMKEAMLSACDKAFSWWNPFKFVCVIQSHTYEIAVSNFGDGAYESAQDEFCEWKCCDL